MKYLSQEEAAKIDEDLMSEQGAYSLDQLMELAGLACAQTLEACYPAKTHGKVMVICGPGNQGGDGLVAARHLHLFGYDVTLYQPKPGKKDIYDRLLRQCRNLHIQEVSSAEEFEKVYGGMDACLDAIFGFSFKPPVRPPFDATLTLLSSSSIPIVSVDIPSGWSVSSGPQPLTNTDFKEVKIIWPQALISLTAPKEGVREFQEQAEAKGARHFLGGRFVPGDLADKYDLDLPTYPGSDQIVEITGL